MARTTMGDLIDRLRQAVGDLDEPRFYTDDQLQAFLDMNRLVDQSDDGYLRRLTPLSPAVVSGALRYTRFRSEAGYWEDGLSLYDSSLQELTPDETDLISGLFVFASEPSMPVYIQGNSYDVDSAAAQALEEWASALARDYDFASSGQDFKRSQQVKHLREAAAGFRRRAPVRAAEKRRGDTRW